MAWHGRGLVWKISVISDYKVWSQRIGYQRAENGWRETLLPIDYTDMSFVPMPPLIKVVCQVFET